MARHAGEFIGTAQQAGLSGCVVRHVTALAGIFSDRAVASHVRLIRSLVRRCGVDADGPVRKIIHLPVHNSARVVTGKAELTSRVVPNEKHGNDMIFTLGVRFMASCALDCESSWCSCCTSVLSGSLLGDLGRNFAVNDVPCSHRETHQSRSAFVTKICTRPRNVARQFTVSGCLFTRVCYIALVSYNGRVAMLH